MGAETCETNLRDALSNCGNRVERSGLCSDLVGWRDSQNENCDWYINCGMCRFDGLGVFENSDGIDAYEACCACGGGQWDNADRRQLTKWNNRCIELEGQDMINC